MEGMAAELAYAKTTVQKVAGVPKKNEPPEGAVEYVDSLDHQAAGAAADTTEVVEGQETNDSVDVDVGARPAWAEVLKTGAVHARAPRGVTLVLLLGNPPP